MVVKGHYKASPVRDASLFLPSRRSRRMHEMTFGVAGRTATFSGYGAPHARRAHPDGKRETETARDDPFCGARECGRSMGLSGRYNFKLICEHSPDARSKARYVLQCGVVVRNYLEW
jgi:hypothetical protein